MNRLNTLLVTFSVVAALHAVPTVADELTTEVQAAAQLPLVALRQANQEQARIALSKTVFDLLAHNSAEQDAKAMMLALQATPINHQKAE